MKITPSFNESIGLMRSNLFFFVLIIILQLVFFICSSVTFHSYSQEMFTSLQSVNTFINDQQWLSQTPTEQNLQELNIPATDLSILYEEYDKMKRATFLLTLSISALFIVLFGMAWTLSYRIVHHKTGIELLVHYGQWALVALVYCVLISALVFSLIWLVAQQFLAENAPSIFLFAICIFFLFFVAYFMPISFALVRHIPPKQLLLETLSLGMRRCVFIFGVYGMFIGLGALLILGMIYSLDVSIFLVLALGIIMLILFAYARILLLVGLNKERT